MTVAEAFKRFRKTFKLTRAEVAETLGINVTSYEYENSGKPANPTAKTLLKLANRYDVSVDYLLGLTDKPRPQPPNFELQQINDRLERIEKLLADKS